MFSILRGNFHQGDVSCFGQGFQCTMIAFVVLLAVFQRYPDPSMLTTSDVNELLITGSQLYDKNALFYGWSNPRYMMHSELPSTVLLWDTVFESFIYDGMFYGIIGRESIPSALTVSFSEALNNGFQISNGLLLTANSATIAVFTHGDAYFIFDSHARNEYGELAADGSAVLMGFDDINEVTAYIELYYSGQQFELSPVVISPLFSNGILTPTMGNSVNMGSPALQSTVGNKNRNNMQNVGASSQKRSDKSCFHITEQRAAKKRKDRNPKVACSQAQNQVQSNFDHTYSKFPAISSSLCMQYINFAPDLAFLNKQANPDTFKYESYIQTTPKFSCKCCKKFLFPNQIAHLRCHSETAQVCDVNVLDNLCSSCYKQISADKIPKLSYRANMFETGLIPSELKCLNSIEKRLVALIQVCMTVVQLPGGQYAERGSVVNFMSPYIDIAKQLPNTNNVIAVRFSDGTASLAKIVSFISVAKIQQALLWLKRNNALYATCELLNMNNDEVVNDEMDFEQMNESCAVPAEYCLPNINVAEAVQHNNLLTLHKIDTPPVSPYEMKNGEEMAFPWLFPEGKNGYLSQRPMKLSLREYFHLRINNSSGIFRKDIQYLFSCVNVCDYQQMLSDIAIHMRMRQPQHSNINITAKDIKNLKDNPDLLQNSYMFMKGIRGTVAYWKNALSNLLAMLKSLGPPTLFVTLSADDCHWPELAMALMNCSFEQVKNHSDFLGELLKKDPYMAAIHFQRRYNALFKFVLKGKQKPLGEIVDFFVRLEFQNRGSCHMHIFYWIKNIPPVTDAKTAEIAVRYIDKTISTCLPNKEKDEYLYNLVKRLQTHSHSDYCLKNRHNCKFGFPFQPVEVTHFYSNVDVTLRGKQYATARSLQDAYINAYNPVILRHFRSNMDIQFVNNAESAAYYICAYLCKAEPDELKREFSKLISDLLCSRENLTLHSKLLKIGCCVLKNRRLSAQEAAFRMSNLKLVQSSRNTVYLNCKPQSKRMKVLKPLVLRSKLPDESTDIFHSNLIDYYYARPKDFENLSLFMFASNYQICSHGNFGSKALPRYKLLNYEKWMKQKQIKNVIRLPKLTLYSEDYYFSLLLLLLPHRNERELLHPYSSAQEALFKKHSLLDNSYNVSSSFLTDSIENAVRLYRLTHDELSEAFMLSSLTEPENMDSESCTNLSLPSIAEMPESQISYCHCNDVMPDYTSDESELHAMQTTTMSENEMLSKIKQLTSDQRHVFDFVKQTISTNQQCKCHLFVTGGGGVGKSYLLSLVADFLTYTTALKYGESPVLLTAPTGTAARHIHGQTLHTALCLPIETEHRIASNNFISAKTLKRLRQRFAFIHTLIIDEISMVSGKTLSQIHERLCLIKDTDEVFGNLNIIAFGDFFQLKPVKGRYAFENKLLWSYFKTLVLSQNVRQCSDKKFVSLLNRARVGSLTSQDIQQLKSRLTKPSTQLLSDTHKSLHLFPKRENVKNLNEKMLNIENNEVISVPALHFYSDNDVAPAEPFNEEHIPPDDRDAGGMPREFTFTIGSRVILLRNIFTAQGLVNGALGKIEGVEYGSNSSSMQHNVPTRIYVRFDDPSIGSILQLSQHHNAIAIEPYDQEFFYEGRCIIRRQFPLNLAWALTIHKAEGATLEKVYCDLGNDIFQPGMAYVALSRTKTLEGLHLFALCIEKIYASPEVLKFYADISKKL